MKKKKFFKNKIQMVLYILIFIVCLVAFIVIGNTDFKKDEETESQKFSAIYKNIKEDNLFVFSNSADILNIVKGNSGVILMGFPTNKWTEDIAILLEEACEINNIDKIYYYDFLKDRDESNGTYETIVKKLSIYVPINDIDIQDIMAPTVLIIKNGNVIAYFDDLVPKNGKVEKDDYFNENEIARIKEKFNAALIEYNRG